MECSIYFPNHSLNYKKMRKLVLKQNEPREQFDERFKELFGVTFTQWQETAEVTSDPELIEYNDGNIYAGMSVYENGFSVYSNVCYKCGKPAVAD